MYAMNAKMKKNKKSRFDRCETHATVSDCTGWMRNIREAVNPAIIDGKSKLLPLFFFGSLFE